MIGLITPPAGIVLALTATVAETSVEAISRQIWPFIICSVLVVMLCIFIPELSLWLPRKLGF